MGMPVRVKKSRVLVMRVRMEIPALSRDMDLKTSAARTVQTMRLEHMQMGLPWMKPRLRKKGREMGARGLR